jgi:hypothetical protein
LKLTIAEKITVADSVGFFAALFRARTAHAAENLFST